MKDTFVLRRDVISKVRKYHGNFRNVISFTTVETKQTNRLLGTARVIRSLSYRQCYCNRIATE